MNLSDMSTPSSHTAVADERYPIGHADRNPSEHDRSAHVAALREFPSRFAATFADLEAEQLAVPYREGGWTLRQLAHHVADSHMNAWIRIKLALTEDWPTIRPYNEKLWAETAEVAGPIEPSLMLLAALHGRMAALFESLTPAQWERGYIHPESGRTSLQQVAALYSWHGHHHLAHAMRLRQKMGW